MAAKRKLFIVHAGELAHRLSRAVGSGGLVARFVRSYVERHNRPGLLGDAVRMHELESTIGREILLRMAADLQPRVSRAFVSEGRAVPRPEEVALSEAFFAEFLASLCRALASSLEEASGEAQAFYRDLLMYQRWGPLRGPGERSDLAGTLRSPFADRCALLLDPSMMEMARRAASEFEPEVLRLGARTFAQMGWSAVRRRKPGRKQRRSGKRRRSGKKTPRRPKASERPRGEKKAPPGKRAGRRNRG